MKWYGSVNNRIEENQQFCNEITVGTGMTEYYWSDTRAYEVVEVVDQKHVYVREYDHKLKGGAYSNDWELISNENRPVSYLTKRGKYWYWTLTVTPDMIDDTWESDLFLAQHGIIREDLLKRGKVTRYARANVSFGIARYYYDYEF